VLIRHDEATTNDTVAQALPRDRVYVLLVLTLVYAFNIADRFSISTLIEPIRHELALSDAGIAFLTGVALALFYVTLGIPQKRHPRPGQGRYPRIG
jgi:hypothetical protein